MPTSTKVATSVEHVVLLDHEGHPRGTAAKATAHSGATDLHLAFSCHVVSGDGRVLLTRRALTKRTWPGTWTNGCCGHPQLGETLREAVERRVRDELGMRVVRASVALPDFAYRAEMVDGTVEHELCPVVIAEVTGAASPDPDEVDDLLWLPWADVVQRVEREPSSLSPWSVEQIRLLDDLGVDPHTWLAGCDASLTEPLLDRQVGSTGIRRRRAGAVERSPRPGRRPRSAQRDARPVPRRQDGGDRGARPGARRDDG